LDIKDISSIVRLLRIDQLVNLTSAVTCIWHCATEATAQEVQCQMSSSRHR